MCYRAHPVRVQHSKIPVKVVLEVITISNLPTFQLRKCLHTPFLPARSPQAKDRNWPRRVTGSDEARPWTARSSDPTLDTPKFQDTKLLILLKTSNIINVDYAKERGGVNLQLPHMIQESTRIPLWEETSSSAFSSRPCWHYQIDHIWLQEHTLMEQKITRTYRDSDTLDEKDVKIEYLTGVQLLNILKLGFGGYLYKLISETEKVFWLNFNYVFQQSRDGWFLNSVVLKKKQE